jgi:hypothetical protein
MKFVDADYQQCQRAQQGKAAKKCLFHHEHLVVGVRKNTVVSTVLEVLSMDNHGAARKLLRSLWSPAAAALIMTWTRWPTFAMRTAMLMVFQDLLLIVS